MYSHNQLIFPSHLEKNSRFLVLAGFSLNGPVGTPFGLRDGVDPYEVLGNCPMAENLVIARQYGITPLILRLNGTHGEATLMHEEQGVPVLRFKTVEAHDECNNIMIHLFPTHMVVKGLYTSYSYYFADYKNLHEMVFAINQHHAFAQGEIEVEILNALPLSGLCITEKYLSFENADDGYHYMTTPEDTEDKMQMQLELLRGSMIEGEGNDLYYAGELIGYTTDTVVFTDIPYEKAPAALTSIFGEFAKAKTEEQNLFCSVIIGSDYFSGPRLDENEEDTYTGAVLALLDYKNQLAEGTYLQHIEVVLGSQDAINAEKGAVSCAASYASMRFSQLKFYESATNKGLPTVGSLLSKELEQDEVAKLSGSGYICIVPSIKKGFVPFSSKNLYSQYPLFSKPNYLRSIHYDVRRITGFFNQHIGEPLSITLLQSILQQVNTFSEELLDNHPLYKNLFIEVIDYSPQQVSLSLAFELYGEVESIRTSFTYTPSSEVSVQW
ncbi:hypothetical protein [Cytobacillus oceanisediminis]|uniref:hypothetical protein n=1 Tax=Cytobacillus oceanisediminis TaxID=665099 RepID=UPI001FB3C8F0|nr:hypothetical protein [Cytobacillus oceanisediminis]UOE58088.1 hypothetical protein IRB79_27900 [Cytobacillus oceanisediminis]